MSNILEKDYQDSLQKANIEIEKLQKENIELNRLIEYYELRCNQMAMNIDMYEGRLNNN